MGGEGKNPYARSGVDYDQLDPFKRACQEAARRTEKGSLAEALGMECLGWTRGESAFVIKLNEEMRLFAHVEEGLGTKNLVADAMAKLAGSDFAYYRAIANDAVAMIVNDLLTLGMMPLTVAMHLAVGSSDWFRDTVRSEGLIVGWEEACRASRAVWSGGETPTLRDVILPKTFMLSGSAIGVAPKNRCLSPDRIQNGDLIVFLRSTGIHANGLTLARKIAAHLSKDKRALDGYLRPLENGMPYGAALLMPTPIYVQIMERFIQSADAHYAVNITGHGWRKLMRAEIDAEYVIEKIPEPQPVFRFMQEHNPAGPISNRDAYADLNMGAGFAVYIDPQYADRVQPIAKSCNMEALIAGHVKRPGTRRVAIKPLDIVFDASSLGVR